MRILHVEYRPKLIAKFRRLAEKRGHYVTSANNLLEALIYFGEKELIKDFTKDIPGWIEHHYHLNIDKDFAAVLISLNLPIRTDDNCSPKYREAAPYGLLLSQLLKDRLIPVVIYTPQSTDTVGGEWLWQMSKVLQIDCMLNVFDEKWFDLLKMLEEKCGEKPKEKKVYELYTPMKTKRKK